MRRNRDEQMTSRIAHTLESSKGRHARGHANYDSAGGRVEASLGA